MQKSSSNRKDSLPMWHVVLHDSDYHTAGYVMRMCIDIFGMSPQEAASVAYAVHTFGTVVLESTHLEKAELRQEQITELGPDESVEGSFSSMRVTLHPVTE